MFISTPEFVSAEIDYRHSQARASWRSAARPRRRVRIARATAPQPR